ncbi:hypothetical protein WN51_04732 [Melipona quadrifasciata]|uniref:Uncharacterized protein n=1 Tax=Melipona quadrifasciata TaxID=166423 RepID=A0A0M8ZVE4_9HYME|nr:hypothetical protein WN51_04732 [Melipona quadrifasciata]
MASRWPNDIKHIQSATFGPTPGRVTSCFLASTYDALFSLCKFESHSFPPSCIKCFAAFAIYPARYPNFSSLNLLSTSVLASASMDGKL